MIHPSHTGQSIEDRVHKAAEEALQSQSFVSAIDVLCGLGWLHGNQFAEWRQGRLPNIESVVQAGPGKLSLAMEEFHKWALARGLKPSETEYVSRTRDRRALQFSRSGDPEIEKRYRTHYVSAELSEKKRERLAAKQSKAPDLVVIMPLGEWKCPKCGEGGELGFMEDGAPHCLACVDLDHLVFLPSGDATLTRRARAASGLSAVVVRFSRSRNRYERKGALVEAEALRRAEADCCADADERALARARDEERRLGLDVQFVARMADAIARLFPACPRDEAAAIARHTALRGSGRVGRSAAGKALDEEALTLAVAAHVRHQKTPYDRLLMGGTDREAARAEVKDAVRKVLEAWRRDAGK